MQFVAACVGDGTSGYRPFDDTPLVAGTLRGRRRHLIGGLLIDALSLGAVIAFTWAAMELGGVAALRRLVASIGAFLVAALLRDPIGSLFEKMLGTSYDFSRLIGMICVGAGSYWALAIITNYAIGRRAERRLEAAEFEDELDSNVLEHPYVAGLAGSVLGITWVSLVVGLIVLVPSTSGASTAAINSLVGGVLIQNRAGLEWFTDGFPHYTQTLPKGDLGTVVGERSNLNFRGAVTSRPVPRDEGKLLFELNAARRANNVTTLAYNPDVARVAVRHARSLAQDHELAYGTPGGSTLDGRVGASLGESALSFAPEIGIEVAWSHSAGNVSKGLLENTRAKALLTNKRWSEIGIGVIDAGWFNGRIYVLVLIEPLRGNDVEASAGTDDARAEPESGPR